MITSGRAMLLAALALALPLGACGGPPWVMARSSDVITLRWYADNPKAAQAQAVATGYCAETSRPAMLVDLEQSGSAKFARYDCVGAPGSLVTIAERSR